MLKHWAAGLRKRWAAGLVGGIAAAVVLAAAIAWAVFVLGADWLAHHDVGSAKGPLLQTARDAARGRLLTLAAGLFAAGALWFTARNFTLSRRTFELTEQGQVTDRYTKAIEQVGSDKLDVRIGGIYALERVARDSARDHPTVMEVLTAFIREHSDEPWPPSDPGGLERERSTRPDVQAAVTVVGRRDAKRDIRPIDLTGADLTRGDLHGAHLAGADLTRATLTRA
jgi:Pentapeptide repeats (8 copies)